ncbi:MAG: TonB family protein [Proteobacteria bacterium]|nr:TonB family protein [Pseudomonadota bacterium]NIS70591.1 TonB family protein [Pseudomonadota bacterium]
MHRDIVLGIVFSILFHGTLLWLGPRIQEDSTRARSIRKTLDLSIMTIYTHREDSGKKASQKTRRIAPSRIPPRSPVRPVFAKTDNMAARGVTEKVKTPEKALESREVVRRPPLLEHLPAPKPVWNARVIVKDTSPSSQSLASLRAPLAALKQEPVLDSDAPSFGILRPIEWMDDTSQPPLREATDGNLVTPPQQLRMSTKPLHEGELGSRISHETQGPSRPDDQIIEAVPDYAVNPKPLYPKLAVLRGQEGTVTLLVEVLLDGSVGEVEIFESSGYVILDRSALKAVQKWRFKPGTRMGKPLTMKVKVPLVFRLGKDLSG